MELVHQQLKRWRDRGRLKRLRSRLKEDETSFQTKVKTEQLRRGSDEWEEAYRDYENQSELTEGEIEEIETRHYLTRAKAWHVPIPPLPVSEYRVYDDKYWDWHRVHGRYYLSADGKAYLRRECYAEMEMFFKPWVTWSALGISIISLAFSILKP